MRSARTATIRVVDVDAVAAVGEKRHRRGGRRPSRPPAKTRLVQTRPSASLAGLGPKSSARIFAVRGQVNALAVAVLAGGGRGAIAVQENVAREAAMRAMCKANARAMAAQEMFSLAVAAQEVVARADR